MQLGMIGLGRMGSNMVRRLIKNGHRCVVFDQLPKAVKDLAKGRTVGAASLADLVKKLAKPRYNELFSICVCRLDIGKESIDVRHFVVFVAEATHLDEIKPQDRQLIHCGSILPVADEQKIWRFEKGCQVSLY